MNDRLHSVPPRNVIDISDLPDHAMDSRDPVWWGNLLLILIETTTIALLLVSYFYLRRNFNQWPPPRIDELPVVGKPIPDLRFGTINLILLLGGCIPMYICDMAARKHEAWKVRGWLALMFIISLATIYFRFKEFPLLKIKWDDNAYGSLVWLILGLHLTYLLGACAEFFIIWIYVLTHELDPHHALDVTLMGGYWYWTAGTWAAIYVVVYFGARFL